MSQHIGRLIHSLLRLVMVSLCFPVLVSVFWGADMAHAAELAVHADFDNGNAIVKAIDQQSRVITISPKQIRNVLNIWWHCRITGIQPGETITLKVVDFHGGAGEVNPVYSYDGKVWHRMDDRKSPHRQKFNADSVWIAWNIPYPYRRSLDLAKRLGKSRCVEVQDLCQSEGKRAVKLFRFTDSRVAVKDKKLFWVQARQHAFEPPSSWVAEGLALWLASDSVEAVELRKRAVVYVVPIMDVDNVFDGGTGKDQKPIDFNRCWDDKPHWRAVESVVKKLDEETRKHRLVAFIDVHTPWDREPAHWYSATKNTKDAVAMAKKFGELLVKGIKVAGGANTWENDFRFDYLLDKPVAMSFAMDRWVKEATQGLSLTMELPIWKDNFGNFITPEGLHDYGEGLGRAFLGLCINNLDMRKERLPSKPPVTPKKTVKDGKYITKKALRNWKYRQKVTVSSSMADSDLSGFPALIEITDRNNSLFSNAQPDGKDILFVGSDGTTKLSHEIEEYTNKGTKELVCWVKIPTLSSNSDTIIYMYYGNPICGSQENPKDAWDNNYVGVWHLQEAPANGVGGHIDSTSSSNNGTPHGFAGTSGSTTDGTGNINGADEFDGDYVDFGDNNGFSLSSSDYWSGSFWLKRNPTTARSFPISKFNQDGYEWRVVIKGDGTLGFWVAYTRPGSRHCQIIYPDKLNNIGSWYYVYFEYISDTSCAISVNGANKQYQDSITGDIGFYNSNSALRIGMAASGTEPFNGILDEVRISKTVRSADWIKASYRNQSSPSTYLTSGAQALW